MNDALSYYAAHSPITDPKRYGRLFDGLPTSVARLCEVVQGSLLHYREGEMYGVTVPPGRTARDEARDVATMLEKLLERDDRPLGEARPPEARLVGCCRDFAVLLCSLLRHQGVPARVRYGFSLYFSPTLGCDHVITEYWDRRSARWVLVDPQQDALHREMNKLVFDPHDVPRDWFLSAGRAWELARGGLIAPERFGYDRDLTGIWVMQQYLVHDVAALNKLEMLIGDSWGLGHIGPETTPTDDEAAVLDEAVRLAQTNDMTALRRLYGAQPGLRVPGAFASLSLTHEWREVRFEAG